MKKLIAKWFGLYTLSQLVSFGDYLLSDARKERIHNHSVSAAEFDIKYKAVHDADLNNWKCL